MEDFKFSRTRLLIESTSKSFRLGAYGCLINFCAMCKQKVNKSTKWKLLRVIEREISAYVFISFVSQLDAKKHKKTVWACWNVLSTTSLPSDSSFDTTSNHYQIQFIHFDPNNTEADGKLPIFVLFRLLCLTSWNAKKKLFFMYRKTFVSLIVFLVAFVNEKINSEQNFSSATLHAWN